MLHQTCENFYLSIILTYTLYSPKEHNLNNMSGMARAFSLEISKPFPKDTEEEIRLFQLLVNSYIQSRYNPHFVVTQADIEKLLPKVRLLGEIIGKCCETRIKEYERLIIE